VPGPHVVARRLCPCRRDERGHVFANCQVWGSDAVGLGRMGCEICISQVFVCGLICLPDVSRTLVNEAMPDHLILSLKSFSTGTSGTIGH
jgi:hypothetical protein